MRAAIVRDGPSENVHHGFGNRRGIYQDTTVANAPPRFEENPDQATPAWRRATAIGAAMNHH